MTTQRLRTIAPAICIVVIAGLVFMNPRPPQNLRYAVYSAYVEAGLTGNFHDFGDGRGIVVIDELTNIQSGLTLIQRLRVMSLSLPNLRRRANFPHSLIFGLFWANIGTRKLDRKFKISARYQLVDSKTLKDPTYRPPPESYGYLSFSSIAFNSDLTDALFYTEHICGLCGGGQYVLMRKLHGNWVIVDVYGTWVS